MPGTSADSCGRAVLTLARLSLRRAAAPPAAAPMLPAVSRTVVQAGMPPAELISSAIFFKPPCGRGNALRTAVLGRLKARVFQRA